MNRFTVVLPFLVLGCVEPGATPAEPKTSPPAKPKAPLPAEPTRAPAQAAPAEAPPLPAAPAADPRIRLAEFARDEIGKKEEALCERLCRVRDAIHSLKMADGDPRLATVTALKTAPAEIEETVSEAVDDTRRTRDALAEYRREVFHAQRAYRTAAEAWRERANDFPTGGELHALNLEFAASYEATASDLPKVLEKIDRFAEKLPELEAFLREYKQFLTDFSLFLRAVLDRGSEEPLRKFLDRKNRRHQAVDEYHRLLLRFVEGLRRGAVSPAIQEEVRKEREARELADAAARAEREATRREAEAREKLRREQEEKRRAEAEALARREREASVAKALALRDELFRLGRQMRQEEEELAAKQRRARNPAGLAEEHERRWEYQWRAYKRPVLTPDGGRGWLASGAALEVGAHYPFFEQQTGRYLGLARVTARRSGEVFEVCPEEGSFAGGAFLMAKDAPKQQSRGTPAVASRR